MRRWVIPLMLGFGVALALIIGQRMSTDAMAVVIGVAVGVAASVPASMLLVAMLRRERRTYRAEQMPFSSGMVSNQSQAYPQFQQPQVIVLNPGNMPGQGANQAYMPFSNGSFPMPPANLVQDGGLRRLRVVGDDNDWED
jgi:hypothetical protein